MSSRKSNSREDILVAAEQVVRERGTGHLTLDTVAERAGISKGGLLHHFPTKEALLRALLSRHLERFDRDLQQAGTGRGGGNARAEALKDFVRFGFREDEDNERISAALLAAGASDPKLLTPVREWHQRHFEAFAAGTKYPLRVLVLMLAMDGLWLNELLRTSAFDRGVKAELMEEMLSMAGSIV
ncbi:MAG: TetR/AcrR family transcriptional regulator [Verrucomicrobiales bacterium]|nr:TetR/AcrR family transcriptional regulator [Verrucomicrobiales bacterium]